MQTQFCENLDLDNIVTPVKVKKFVKLLRQSNYDEEEVLFLEDGFTRGFDIGYEGPYVRQSQSKNIPLNNIGNETLLWNKIMKEVKLKRVAGPFKEVPFDNYIQSPIGLVPKTGGWYSLQLSFVI